MGVYTDPTMAIAASYSEQQLPQANENAINVHTTPEKGKELEKLAGKHGNKKGKQVVLRHQPKRMVKEMPFQCRSKTIERLEIN